MESLLSELLCSIGVSLAGVVPGDAKARLRASTAREARHPFERFALARTDRGFSLSWLPFFAARSGIGGCLFVGPLETQLLRSPFDLDGRRRARVFKLELTKPFLELAGLPSHIFALIADRDGLKMLASAYHESTGQQSAGYAYRNDPSNNSRAYRPSHCLIGDPFVRKESVTHTLMPRVDQTSLNGLCQGTDLQPLLQQGLGMAYQSLSHTRRRELRERGLRSISSGVGRTGLRVRIRSRLPAPQRSQTMSSTTSLRRLPLCRLGVSH